MGFERCDCSKHELRRRLASNGLVQLASQCVVCGGQVGLNQPHAAYPKGLIDQLPAWDKELRQRYWESRSADAAQSMKESDAAWWAWYDAYLRSPAWRDKRARVLQRARGICEGCGQERATQVHHLTYAHVGAEFLFELVAVGDICHPRLHPDKNQNL